MNRVITKFSNFDQHSLLFSEWLVTNGLGGFASGSICGAPTRKYHALLIATLPVPLGRTIMLNYVADTIVYNNHEIPLSLLRTKDHQDLERFYLTEYRNEDGIPIWRYEFEDLLLEKRVFLVHRQNTVHMSYKLISGKGSAEILWRPYFHFRTNEEPVNSQIQNESYTVHAHDHHYEIECPGYPLLRLYNTNQAPFTLDQNKIDNVFYEVELIRGYESIGSLTSPGYYSVPLQPLERATFIASIEPWKTIHALTPEEAWSAERQRRKNILKMAGPLTKSKTTAKLVVAADQFIMTPTTRDDDMIRLQAMGEEVRSIIAGFPWFTDWGRDTMISLEGLTLVTGRSKIAYSILRTFAYYIRDGLIPNMFPDGEIKARYNTADATLWFFHAIHKYIQYTRDDDILELLIPKLQDIINSHIKGTHFGIKVDQDGLLTQGQQGVQLTWMDAKVGDWVVTPRRGKAVELNALWYNALKLMEFWTGKTSEIAQQCYESFNKKFWFEGGKYLYDVVEGENGNDSAFRPNQLFTISLSYPVLKEDRWKDVLDNVQKELLTPYGLRTLSRSHPDFKAYYDGDLLARDAAYHQGTVWPWLIGPFIDVWLKVYPEDKESAFNFLKPLKEHINQNTIGTIEEIFDASDPYHARGCFSQAWSVAEFLRCYTRVNPELW